MRAVCRPLTRSVKATEPDASLRTRRPLLLALTVGLAVAVAAVAIAFAVIAIPLFALAGFDQGGPGLDRPVVRDGLLHVAVPAGVVFGLVAGVAVARWYRRGGHLPREWE
jgi:hypothetical protein